MKNDSKSTTKPYIKRGMVFWFNPEVYHADRVITTKRGTCKSNIQSFNRPWLVVSNDYGNDSSPCCNIVPITTEYKAELPVHVCFEYNNSTQTILVEQIRTVDSLALGNYMYTISDDIMKKVEKAILIQLGIKIEEPTVNPDIKLLNNTIKSLGASLEAIVDRLSPKKEIPAIPEEIIPVPKQSVNPPEKKPINKPISQVDKSYARYPQATVTPKIEEPIKPAVESTTKRNKWTLESREQFLRDFDKMSPQELMRKYNITTIQSLFSTKYQCRVALGLKK